MKTLRQAPAGMGGSSRAWKGPESDRYGCPGHMQLSQCPVPIFVILTNVIFITGAKELSRLVRIKN